MSILHPLDDKVCECNGIGDVILFVPDNNWSCIKEPVDEVDNYPDSILITKTPEFIYISTVKDFNADHVIYDLVGRYNFSLTEEV